MWETWSPLVLSQQAFFFAEKHLWNKANLIQTWWHLADWPKHQLTVSLLTTPLLLERRDTFLIGNAIVQTTTSSPRPRALALSWKGACKDWQQQQTSCWVAWGKNQSGVERTTVTGYCDRCSERSGSNLSNHFDSTIPTWDFRVPRTIASY